MNIVNTVDRIVSRFLPRESEWRWKVAQRNELKWWAEKPKSELWKQWSNNIDDFIRHRKSGLSRRTQNGDWISVST